MLPHAPFRSPSICSARLFKLMAAVSPPLSLADAAASSLNSFCQSKLATASALAMSGQFPGAPHPAGAPGTLGIAPPPGILPPQSMSHGAPSADTRIGQETIRQYFELMVFPPPVSTGSP